MKTTTHHEVKRKSKRLYQAADRAAAAGRASAPELRARAFELGVASIALATLAHEAPKCGKPVGRYTCGNAAHLCKGVHRARLSPEQAAEIDWRLGEAGAAYGASRARDAELPTLGMDAVTDAELLARLAQVSTDAARDVFASVGGMAKLAGATVPELRAAGLTPRRAAMVHAAIALGRRAATSRLARGGRIAGAADVWAHFRQRLGQLRVEEFWAVALDVRHRVMSEIMLARGSLTGVEVHPRDVFAPLIRNSAAAVIFCHNHPSNDSTPSRQDIDLTQRLREVGEVCGIPVLDHVVVTNDGYVSLAERNWR